MSRVSESVDQRHCPLPLRGRAAECHDSVVIQIWHWTHGVACSCFDYDDCHSVGFVFLDEIGAKEAVLQVGHYYRLEVRFKERKKLRGK